MVEPLLPQRGGFTRPFGCGWFIREFLLGHGPEGSLKIDVAKSNAESAKRTTYYSKCLKALKIGRLDRLIEDGEGNQIEVSQMIADDKAVDVIARRDAGLSPQVHQDRL